MYEKLLVLHHLILSKDYVPQFADQLLQFTDYIFVNCRSANNQQNFCNIKLFIFVCEGNTYNLLVQRNYFRKHSFSLIAFLQKSVLQICSKFTGGDPYGNVISKKVAQHLCMGCTANLLGICRTGFQKNTSRGLVLTFISFALVQVINNTFY